MRKHDGAYHYSGTGSKQFWKRVNALDHLRPEWMRLYRAGCVLQNLEELILDDLARAEQKKRK